MIDGSIPPLVDTHAHLADVRLHSRIEEVLAKSRSAGVEQIVAIATDASDSEVVLALASEHPEVFAAVGLHPNDLVEGRPEDWERIIELAADPRVVAIGETGVDNYWKKTPLAMQVESFERHLDLASDRNLPVVIHCRDSLDDILRVLRARGGKTRGVLHSFTGNSDDAEALLELGLSISFAGMLTFANKSLEPLRDASRSVPLDRILVETDSPYLSPEPFRGKPNEPARVIHTAQRLADLRGITLADVAESTTRNARELFRLPDHREPGRSSGSEPSARPQIRPDPCNPTSNS